MIEMCNQLRILVKSRGEVTPKRNSWIFTKGGKVIFATRPIKQIQLVIWRSGIAATKLFVVAACLSITIMEMFTTIKLTNYAWVVVQSIIGGNIQHKLKKKNWLPKTRTKLLFSERAVSLLTPRQAVFANKLQIIKFISHLVYSSAQCTF